MASTANPGIAHLDAPRDRSRPNAELLSIHRYLPVAAFYFFLNHAGLNNPGLLYGLFYTTLFSPLIYIWLYLKGRRWLTAKFLLVLSPFILAHMVMGIQNSSAYLRTLLHWWTVYITVYAFCWALRKCRNRYRLFEQLILLNFCAAILAVALFPTPLRHFLWSTGDTIQGSSHLNRLNLFSTEPSAYAELMLPLLVFAALRLLRDSRERSAKYLMMIAFPFLLCQSFGGISIGLAGVGVSLMTGYRRLLRWQKSRLLFLCLAIAIGALLLIPNPISARVRQVASGNDGSTNLRAFYSYLIAYTVASSKSLWWGVGLGQSKLIDVSNLNFGAIHGVPSLVAGTFAEFGIIGVLVLLAVEVYLFFRTRVYQNSFSLAMFVVAFLNQFVGSYGTDIQIYLIWFFAFYPFFADFNLHDHFGLEVSHS